MEERVTQPLGLMDGWVVEVRDDRRKCSTTFLFTRRVVPCVPAFALRPQAYTLHHNNSRSLGNKSLDKMTLLQIYYVSFKVGPSAKRLVIDVQMGRSNPN